MSSDSRENHATNIQTEQIPFSRGRRPNRSYETQLSPTGAQVQVPLRFVHVPNGQHIIHDATHASLRSNRTPSVPDFTSYHVQQQQSPPHLSGEALLHAASSDPMEQFEERLRRAQLCCRNVDFEFVTRLRSRSTPSRGAVHRMRSDDNMRSSALRLQQYIIDGGEAIGRDRDGSNNNEMDHTSAAIDVENSIENTELYVMIAAPAPQSFITDQSHSSHTATLSDSGTQLHHNRNPSSCFSSSSPAHRVPSPPPLPPPSSERERLVQREREARSESERARRRHLALLRERQLSLNENHTIVDPLGGSEASVRNNDRPTSVGSLDVVEQGDTTILDPDQESHPPMQFCDIEVPPTNVPQSSPRDDHVMENAIQNVSLGSDSVVRNTINHVSTSVGSHLSDISEQQPPPLPPPATERERLVMREREARLETERARRRHIAVLREQDRDDNEMTSHVNDNHQGVLGVSLLRQEDAHNETTVDQGDVDTNNNLSYTMERFLETLGDEEASTTGLHVDETDVNIVDTTSLPYTMELFLSENATLVGSNDDTDEIDAPVASIQENLSRNEECISNHESSNSNESVEVLSEYAVMPSPDTILDVTQFASNTNTTDHVERQSSSNMDFEERYVCESPPSDPIDNANFSIHPPNDGISLLHESTDDQTQLSSSTPQMPRLTEEGVAQLTEVDHASIGNAPPMSVRDEPSESSLADIVPFHDHGFSVATQTTAIESITETSQGSVRDVSDLVHQRSDSTDVIRVGVSDSQDIIRVDDAGNCVESNLGASSVSVMAMPSIDSVVDSGSDRHTLSNPSSSGMHSSPSVLESNLSVDEESQILSLTEEGVVTMQEIDNASIGNEPPRSVRDESASESSVVGRGRHNSRNVSFSMFRTPSSGLGDTLTANASVEAMPSIDSVRSMSEDSVDVASGYTQNSLHEESNEINNEDLIVGQGSSDMASIEALPSIADPFDSSIHNANNEAGKGDLVYSGSDRRDSSTSIEALHSDDDLSSANESTRLNGFHQNRSLQESFIDNNTEGTPLLRNALRNRTNANSVMRQQTHSTSQLTTILLAFATGCFIGLGVGLFLFRYKSTE